MASKKKIIVLSDTHIKTPVGLERLDLALKKHALPADMIVHAGDIVNYETLQYLRGLGELKAVYGNMDREEVLEELSPIETFHVNGKQFGLTHGHRFLAAYDGSSELSRYYRFLETFGELDCVIFGHTHKPLNEVVEGLRLFNPGSATDKRFNAQFSLGIIEVGGKIEARIVYF